MKLLGWTGGSLGSSDSGIKEPISVQVKVDRKGLGLSDQSQLNSTYFTNYLKKYRSDESALHELVFSKEFTKEERKNLHE